MSFCLFFIPDPEKSKLFLASAKTELDELEDTDNVRLSDPAGSASDKDTCICIGTAELAAFSPVAVLSLISTFPSEMSMIQ